jgi:hypothetical protein
MTRHALILTFVLAIGSLSGIAQVGSLRINEFQASNATTLKDDDGFYSDWIELFNPTAAAVDLSGWSLTDEVVQPRKWMLPATTLGPGGYLLVFASDKNRRLPGATLHTNFKLTASGEYLALIAPDGKAATEFKPFPEQATDQSYGYLNGAWVQLRSPSPGKWNADTSLLRYPAPAFSKLRGLYTEAFDLYLNCAMRDALILYTTDGSEPSLSNGKSYSGSIPVTGTTVVRAKALVPYPNNAKVGDSRVETHTFLFPDKMAQQGNAPAGYPANWGKYAQQVGNAIADYEMDPVLMAETAYQTSVKQAFSELPIVSVVSDKNNFFNNVNDSVTGGIYMFTGPPVGYTTGRGWERPVSFEYFYAADSVSLQADCGIEIHGGHSRLPEKCPKHAFKIDFKSKYGPSRLNFPMFGPNEAPSLNSFNLRGGFGNTWAHQSSAGRTLAVYARDEWAKVTHKRMGQLSANLAYVHLFLNGLYWGLYNVAEKIDEDFCETYLGGNKLDYDVIESSEVAPAPSIVASSGTMDAWNSLFAQVATASDSAVYQKIQGNNPDGTPNPAYPALIDMANFIDYMLLNFYDGNTDWDHHNWVAVRSRVAPDKGFRFLSWDSEEVLKLVTENLLTENNTLCPSYLFQQLRKNPQFVRLFADRVQKHCFNKGALTPTKAAETFTYLTSQIEQSVYAEAARWGDYRKDVHSWQTAPYELYRKEVHFDAQKKILLETYFPQRTTNFVNQLKTASLFPSVAAPVFKVNGLVPVGDTLLPGDQLTMTAASGSIYYTDDTSDPVNWSGTAAGTLSPSARLYSAAIKPTASIPIKARALYQGVWSAMNEQDFVFKTVVGLTPEARLMAQVRVDNVPNPFTDRTVFHCELPFEGFVRLQIYDLSGRLVSTVLNERLDAGTYERALDGSSLPRGIFLCRFSVEGALKQQQVFKISKW